MLTFFKGQLGLGNFTNSTTPKLLMVDNQIKQICCGWDFSLVLKSYELVGFGSNK